MRFYRYLRGLYPALVPWYSQAPKLPLERLLLPLIGMFEGHQSLKLRVGCFDRETHLPGENVWLLINN